MAVDTVHQCPHCELRFAYRPELEDHVRRDHEPVPGDDLATTLPASAGTVIVPEFVLGSVARGVVHPADCPVTVVPPVPETAPGCSDGKPS